MKHEDLLSRVVAELEKREGVLKDVAAATGLNYDTLLRIKRRDTDPRYSNVRTLGVYFGLLRASSVKQEASHG